LAVLAITALKDGYEDIKRHQADRKINHSIVYILKGGEGYHEGPLNHHIDSSLTEPKPGYHNYNAMTAKSKTFVPAIPLPKGKKRKASAKANATTDALSQGVVAAGDKDWQSPRPGGGHGMVGDESPFADHNGPHTEKVINSPASDPEAFDDIKELGWQQTKWEDVRVGDFIKISDNEQIPAGKYRLRMLEKIVI
jgi:phospholipid-translocating ATPase